MSASPSSPKSRAPQTIDLKDRRVAAFLTWLLPGLGHFYQGRIFKGLIYASCILGTVYGGYLLGDGKVLNVAPDFLRTQTRTAGKQRVRVFVQNVLQYGIGVNAIPMIIQSQRNESDLNVERESSTLLQPLKGEFEGTLTQLRIGEEADAVANVLGKIELKPANSEGFERRVDGTFKGVIRAIPGEPLSVKSETPIELNLTMLREIDPEIFPSPNREISCEFEGKVLDASGLSLRGEISGEILQGRPVWDRYAAPMDERGINDVNGNLGKYFEIGLLFVWMANLLNLFAILDAYYGPAEGYREDDEAALAVNDLAS